MAPTIAVLGGGNTAFAVAAKLTLDGARVTLCEVPDFRHTLEPIGDTRKIGLTGVTGEGEPTIHHVTTDLRSGLSEAELVLLIVPSYAHRAFAKACGPHLQSGQVVVLMPGNLGSFEFLRIVRECGSTATVTVAETDTAPYVCRKLTSTSAHIWGVVSALGLGALPGSRVSRVQSLLEPWFPNLRPYDSALAAGLASMNPVVHPAGVLLNAGRIERSRGEFYFYEEGITPGVCRLIHAVDGERLAIAEALETELAPVDQAFHLAGFGPRGDLWATINGSRMLTQLRAPVTLDSRWLTEDVPFGLATWSLLGTQVGVDCPVMRSIVDLTSKMLGVDFWEMARRPEHLGIHRMSKRALLEFSLDGGTHSL